MHQASCSVSHVTGPVRASSTPLLAICKQALLRSPPLSGRPCDEGVGVPVSVTVGVRACEEQAAPSPQGCLGTEGR